MIQLCSYRCSVAAALVLVAACGSRAGFHDELDIVPATLVAGQGATVRFAPVGGIGPYLFSSTGVGHIDSDSGVYVATAVGDGRVRITDVDGVWAEASITIQQPKGGTLDGRFGQRGVRRLSLGRSRASVADMVVDSGDRIWLLAHVLRVDALNNSDTELALVRLHGSGETDAEFGQHGGVTYRFGFERVTAIAMTLLDDSPVIVGRHYISPTYADFIAKLSEDGSLDPSFGGGVPITVSDLGHAGDRLYDMATLDDGRLLILGMEYDSSARKNNACVVYRLQPDGSFDASFAGGGRARTPFTPTLSSAKGCRHLSVLSSGKLMLLGEGNSSNMAIRLLADGTTDTSFATEGLFSYTRRGGESVFFAAHLLDDGRTALVGSYTGRPAMVIVTDEGTIAFDARDNGVVVAPVPVGGEFVATLRLADQSSLAVGNLANGANSVLYLERTSHRAEPVLTFGDGGSAFVDIVQGSDAVVTLREGPPGTVLVAGNNGSDADLFVARLWQ